MGQGTVIRAVRYRVLPGTRAKARRLNRIAGACRYVWNRMLEDQQTLHDTAKMCGASAPSPTFFTLSKAFTDLRKSNGHEWLKDLPFAIVRYTLKRQAHAWQRFFRGQGGHPRFKGRCGAMGFTVPDNVRIRDNRIAIPKTGTFRLRRRGGNPYPDGVPKQAIFKAEGGKWFCTVFLEVSARPRRDDGSAIGVDRNVGQCALSTGEIVRLPDLSKLEAQRRRYQRRMARQVKGSGRRRCTRAKLSRTCRRIAGARANWCHQTSRRIADAAHTVVLEALNTQGMTRSAKGTAEAPGTNVRAKAGLNRAILSSGWGALEQHLDYKAGRVVRINPAYTSQTCHACGCVESANRPSQSFFRCQACGHTANADVNAAQNIRRQGLAQLDGEGRGHKRARGSPARPGTRQKGGRIQPH